MRFYPPFILLFFFIAFFCIVFFFVMLQLQVISFAFEKLGFSPFGAFLILMGTLVGSLVNIPVRELPGEKFIEQGVSFFGMRYSIPVMRNEKTLLAVNLGGAIIPGTVSIFLWLKGGVFIPLLAVAIVSLVVNRVARPVRGLGIATPIFVPPLVTLVVALVLAPHDAPRIAYIAGTLGTLIGADLMNLGKIRNLGAPVASIGGAGTFDGIFITGIMAVLLA